MEIDKILKHTQFIEIQTVATFVSTFNVSINHYYRKTLTLYLNDNIFPCHLEIILNNVYYSNLFD